MLILSRVYITSWTEFGVWTGERSKIGQLPETFGVLGELETKNWCKEPSGYGAQNWRPRFGRSGLLGFNASHSSDAAVVPINPPNPPMAKKRCPILSIISLRMFMIFFTGSFPQSFRTVTILPLRGLAGCPKTTSNRKVLVLLRGVLRAFTFAPNAKVTKHHNCSRIRPYTSKYFLRRHVDPPGTHPKHLRNEGIWRPRERWIVLHIGVVLRSDNPRLNPPHAIQHLQFCEVNPLVFS